MMSGASSISSTLTKGEYNSLYKKAPTNTDAFFSEFRLELDFDFRHHERLSVFAREQFARSCMTEDGFVFGIHF